jgi:hypothetical protein
MEPARRSFAVSAAFSLLLGVVVGSGCSGTSGGGPGDGGGSDASSSDARGCVPGQQVACACPGSGLMGAQTCYDNGQGFGSCRGCSDAGVSLSDDGGNGSDAGPGGSDGASVGGQGFDGTSGKACTSDVACRNAGGPGVNRCSTGLTLTVAGVKAAPLTTPVCLVPPGPGGAYNCDPAPLSDPAGQLPHFCDGPDDPSAPGICAPTSNPPTSGQGICFPKCTFAIDGTSAKGCIGNAACSPLLFAVDASNVVTGYGSCQGYCSVDADCSGLGAGYVCQADIGFCTKTPVTRTGQRGAACPGSNANACFCVLGQSGSGYCTTSCVVGGAACPTGWACDNGTPASLTFATGTFSVTAQAPGTAGQCLERCTAGTTTCPAGATCTALTVAGPDCVP